MKEDDRIVELLAELLQKEDRTDGRFEKISVILEKQSQILGDHEQTLIDQGKLLERHGQLLEKLVEGQLI